MGSRIRGGRVVVIALALAAGAACATRPAGSTAQSGDPGAGRRLPVGKPFVLAPGEKAFFEEPRVEIEFVGVAADSRCPSDVTCVWTGDAEVELALRPAGGAAQSLRLHTHVEPRAAGAADLRLELVDLAPYPRSGSPIAPGDYRATLRAERAE